MLESLGQIRRCKNARKAQEKDEKKILLLLGKILRFKVEQELTACQQPVLFGSTC
jgi:hypothetical protein